MGNALLCCETERPEDRKKKESKLNNTMKKNQTVNEQKKEKEK